MKRGKMAIKVPFVWLPEDEYRDYKGVFSYLASEDGRYLDVTLLDSFFTQPKGAKFDYVDVDSAGTMWFFYDVENPAPVFALRDREPMSPVYKLYDDIGAWRQTDGTWNYNDKFTFKTKIRLNGISQLKGVRIPNRSGEYEAFLDRSKLRVIRPDRFDINLERICVK